LLDVQAELFGSLDGQSVRSVLPQALVRRLRRQLSELPSQLVTQSAPDS
jgi:hypothetical protein